MMAGEDIIVGKNEDGVGIPVGKEESVEHEVNELDAPGVLPREILYRS